MSKKISGTLTFTCTFLLTFGIFTMLKLTTTDKPEGPKAIPASQIQLDGKMTPEALLALGRLSDPQVSPNGKWILYGVSYTDVNENRSCRNLFAVSLDGSQKKTISCEGKSVSNARWFGNNHIIYLQGGQIWKAKLGKGKLCSKVQLSNVPNGISEFAFSPDGGQILFISTIDGPVRTPGKIYDDLSKAEAFEADDLLHRHWDHWVTEIPHSYICACNGLKKGSITIERSIDILGADCPFELPTEPFGGIEQLSWSLDGRFVAYSCRKLTGKQYAFSTNTDIYIYDILTGATTQVTSGGGYDTDPIWGPCGKIAWVSMARDGYEADQQRLMIADVEIAGEEEGQTLIKVGEPRQIIKDFPTDVASPRWIGNEIWFNSLSEGAVQGIFKVDASLENVERLTEVEDWHDYSTPFLITKEGLYTTRQSMNRPAEIVCLLADGSVKEITDENGHIFNQLEEPKMEKRMITTVDGEQMLTWVMYPPKFDSSKQYPAITICLGGPQGTISQGWSYRWCYRLMAEQGYIVVLPNRRGTTAFGQPWKEQISGDYSGLNIQDYLSAARELKKEPYVGKMAACGASYGGYSVYYLCGNHEDTFDCFIAHAGIFNEEHMYYTTEEMWFANWDNGGLTEYAYKEGQTGAAGDGITFGGMQQAGSPWSTAPKAQKHYSMSPHKFVQNWHTPLLVIHGGMDFRVPVDEGMAAFNCAQMMGVPSKMIVFPGENHWILKPQNALFWHREYFSWLDLWCK